MENLCRVCGLDDWDDPEFKEMMRDSLPADHYDLRHRKAWEWVMGMLSLKKIGALKKEAVALGVGSGTEIPLFWLTNHIRYVIATDLYTISTWRDREADMTMLSNPEKLSPIPFNRRRLGVMIMDGTQLDFEDETFDIVFSYCSIEHFGSGDRSQVEQSMQEMERVLKPNGVLSLTTEICIEGLKELFQLRKSEKPFASDIFTPHELDKYILKSTNLQLFGDLDFTIGKSDLLKAIKYPEEVNKLPHVILDYNGAIFTSCNLVFKKA